MQFPVISARGGRYAYQAPSHKTPKPQTVFSTPLQDSFQNKKHAPSPPITFSGSASLLDAIPTNNMAAVERCLARGADIQEKDQRGNNALHLLVCSVFPDPEVLALLLSSEIDPNAENLAGQTPLALLVRNPTSDKSLLGVFLASPKVDANKADRYGHTALHYLATNLNHDPEQFQLLAAQPGIQINQTDKAGKTPLEHLLYPRYAPRGLNKRRVFITGQSPLPNIDSVKMLLKAGAEIKDNRQRARIFQLAKARQDINLLVSIITPELVLHDMDKQQVFRIARAQEHSRLMALILKQGAKISETDNPKDHLANRLLSNPNNYLHLQRHLGHRTHSFIRQIIADDIESDMKTADLTQFQPGRSPRKMAKRIAKSIWSDFRPILKRYRLGSASQENTVNPQDG